MVNRREKGTGILDGANRLKYKGRTQAKENHKPNHHVSPKQKELIDIVVDTQVQCHTVKNVIVKAHSAPQPPSHRKQNKPK